MQTRSRSWWREEVQRFEKSGQSARAFAEGKGYSSRSLNFWRREHRRVPAREKEQVELVPVHVTRTEASLFVVRVGGAQLEVRAGFDKGLLREVVATLAGLR